LLYPTMTRRERLEKKIIGPLPSGKSNRVSTAAAPSYEGDDRTDQEHNSGSEGEISNPLSDLCLLLDLFAFLRRRASLHYPAFQASTSRHFNRQSAAQSACSLRATLIAI
jgi:hypothetical protein